MLNLRAPFSFRWEDGVPSRPHRLLQLKLDEAIMCAQTASHLSTTAKGPATQELNRWRFYLFWWFSPASLCYSSLPMMRSKFALESFLTGYSICSWLACWFGGKCANISSTYCNNVLLLLFSAICKMSFNTFQEALIIAGSKRPCLWRKGNKN